MTEKLLTGTLSLNTTNQLHHVSKPYAWYHDPSSSISPDILFTRLLYYTKLPSRKREIIQSNIYRILPKVNQFIYSLDTFGMPNIMTLAQVVLQIFCSQCPLWVKFLSPKRGIIQSNFDRILWKVNQVIYIMYPNCSSSGSPDILFTRLLYYTKWQSQKREISVKYLENFTKS